MVIGMSGYLHTEKIIYIGVIPFMLIIVMIQLLNLGPQKMLILHLHRPLLPHHNQEK